VSIRAEYERRCVEPSDIFAHLPRLYTEASRPGVKVIELGVRSGNSTAAFLLAAEEQEGHVWSVDLDPPHVRWTGHPRWSFLHGDDLWLASQLPDEVDVVFIDTSHLYEQTQAELEIYVPKVKPGGVVLLHDTELEQPESAPQFPRFPVRVAVDEFCGENGLSCEFVPGCNGLGVIRIGDDGD
jgi:predicted O-methyltransferase YrrM